MPSNLLNYVLYQTGWLAAVFGAANDRAWSGAGVACLLMAAHLGLARRRRAEWRLVAVTFPSGNVAPWLCPPWIVVMWMQFATTFRFSLRWLLGRWSHAAAAGTLGGPLAYVVGERIGAVELGEPRALTLAVLSGLWLIVVPALAWFGRSVEPGSYRSFHHAS